jgi:sugar O-acyltransferase (sialic acid O-acetyltransferase NeuD family)
MINRLILVGGGDLAREIVCWLIHSDQRITSRVKLCFIDDNRNSMIASGVSLEYLGTIDSFFPLPGDKVLYGIADIFVRKRVVKLLSSRNCVAESFIHPSVITALSSKIGLGCILLPYSIVSENVFIGNYTILNCQSSVGHDAVIGSFVTISSHVDITGHCVVEDEAFLGSGSRILPGKRVGHGAVVGAGAVASRSVPSRNTLYPVQCKLLYTQQS